MSCPTCNQSEPVTPCPTCDPVVCPAPNPCDNVIPATCVIYTGVNILCGTDVVVSTNMTVSEAITAINVYFCETIAVLQQTAAGLTLRRTSKFVHNGTTNLNLDVITIPGGSFTPAVSSSTDVGFADSLVDLQVQVYVKDTGSAWYLLPTVRTNPAAGPDTCLVSIDDLTGDITVIFHGAFSATLVPYKIVVIF